MERLKTLFFRCWTALRRLTNDDAYERYIKHFDGHCCQATPLTPSEFFQREQERKWESINRCC